MKNTILCLAVLFTLTLTVRTGFSQSARTVINKDTLYLVPVKNLRRANMIIVERDYLAEKAGTLRLQNRQLAKRGDLYKQMAAQADSAATGYRKAYETEGKAVVVANKALKELYAKYKRTKLAVSIMGPALIIFLTLILIL